MYLYKIHRFGIVQKKSSTIHTWNITSIIYWVLLSKVDSCKTVRKLSKMALMPLGDTSLNFCPHSFKKVIATSTESSVGESNKSVKISNDKSSWTTCWLTKWAINLVEDIQRVLSFLLKPRRKFNMSLFSNSSPIFGNLVLIMATKAIKKN